MDEEKTIIFIDDSVDIGKEPLPITDPEIKKLYDWFVNVYKNKADKEE